MKKIISMLFATLLVIGFTSNANAAKTLKCQTVLNTALVSLHRRDSKGLPDRDCVPNR